MGKNSAIEWCTHTFNPWWGCEKISPGCQHCYAAELAARYGFRDLWGPSSVRRTFSAKHWDEPVNWNRAALAAIERGEITTNRPRVFCASMADVMEAGHDLDEHRERLYTLIERTPALDWLLLTKRPENFASLLPWAGRGERPPSNVWLLATVETDAYRYRLDSLLSVPAVVHGVSVEPMLGPLDLTPWLYPKCRGCLQLRPRGSEPCPYCESPPHHARPALQWVIIGGESGSHARPANPLHVRDLIAQCECAGVAAFFKQWGEWAPRGVGLVQVQKIGKKRAGRTLDGRTWDEVPHSNWGEVSC